MGSRVQIPPTKSEINRAIQTADIMAKRIRLVRDGYIQIRLGRDVTIYGFGA